MRVAPCRCHRSILPSCLLEVLRVLVQPVEALVPEPLEPAGPLVNRSQSAGVEAVQPLLAGLAIPHQPDLAEHPQVLGGPRLGDPQLLGQLGHRQLAPTKQHQDLPALRLGHRVEDVRRRRCTCHGHIIFRYRHASTPVEDEREMWSLSTRQPSTASPARAMVTTWLTTPRSRTASPRSSTRSTASVARSSQVRSPSTRSTPDCAASRSSSTSAGTCCASAGPGASSDRTPTKPRSAPSAPSRATPAELHCPRDPSDREAVPEAEERVVVARHVLAVGAHLVHRAGQVERQATDGSDGADQGG